MSARPDSWMPLYWGDYLRDTMHLRTEGHGAYLLLIGAYWTSGMPLPDDDEHLAAVSRLDTKAWKRLRPTLERFFDVSDGVWRHGRIDKELEKANAISEARRAAGRQGGRPKQTESKPKANGLPEHKQNETQPQPQPQSSAAMDGYAVWELWQDRRKHHGHGTDAAPPSPKLIAMAQGWLDAGAAVPMIRQAFDAALGRSDPPRSLAYCDGAIRDALNVKPVEVKRVLSRDEIAAGRVKSFHKTGFWDSSWGPKPSEAA